MILFQHLPTNWPFPPSPSFETVLFSCTSSFLIRCTLATTSFWKHLVATLLLTQHVHSPEIQSQHRGLILHSGTSNSGPQPQPIVPNNGQKQQLILRVASSIAHQLEPRILPVCDAEYWLIQALKNMVNLESFIWDREPPVYNSTVNDGEDENLGTVLRDIWPGLISTSTPADPYITGQIPKKAIKIKK